MKKLFDVLTKIFKGSFLSKWRKVVLYAELSENGYDISFYCFKDELSVPVQCYDMERFGVKETTINDTIDKVYEALKPFWNGSVKSDKGAWTNCTFILTKNECSMDVDYTDLVDCAYEYREQWKKRYLEHG